MSYLSGNRGNAVGRAGSLWHAALLLLVAGTVSSCGNAPQKTATEGTAQKVFATPANAGAAFLEAAKSGDQAALLAIFGPDGRTALFSGDAVKDKDNLQDFVAAYNQMHRWREIKVGGEVLYVGADNYPFPIPLGKNAAGQWAFDTAAGKDEILARRIGRDELTAIAASSAVAEAQAKYFSMQKQYAQKFISDEGKRMDCTGRLRLARRQVHWRMFAISPKPPVTPTPGRNRSHSTATTSAYSPDKVTRPKVGRRTTS